MTKFKIMLLSVFIMIVNSYIQLQLSKRKIQTTKQLLCQQKKQNKKNSKKEQFQIFSYEQFCYSKDLSYYIQLFYQQKVYEISMDLTSPISWLKGQSCKITNSHDKKCQILNPTIKQKIKNKILERKKVNQKSSILHTQNQEQNQIQAQKVKKKDKENIKDKDEQQLVQIYGSNQIISGYLQKNKDVEFWTKDSGKLSRLIDILMLGFFFTQEKEKINLKNSNFIKATQLSSTSNSLSDGALSLRFDQISQNSFLSQIFQFCQVDEKVITIYINERQSLITIGELSIKHSKQGYSGIRWTSLQKQETKFGNLASITSIRIQKQNEDKIVMEDSQVNAILSLSASYVGIPQSLLDKFIRYFQNLSISCKTNSDFYLECTFSNKKIIQKFKNIQFIFQLEDISISLQVATLILAQNKKMVVLNLKEVHQKQYIILGQPIFLKYFVILDYKKSRIGFSQKKQLNQTQLVNVVTLIRFVSFIFFIGCSILLCFGPIQKMIHTFKGRSYEKKQVRRLRYSTEQNNYDEVNQKLKEVFEQSTP